MKFILLFMVIFSTETYSREKGCDKITDYLKKQECIKRENDSWGWANAGQAASFSKEQDTLCESRSREIDIKACKELVKSGCFDCYLGKLDELIMKDSSESCITQECYSASYKVVYEEVMNTLKNDNKITDTKNLDACSSVTGGSRALGQKKIYPAGSEYKV